MTFLKPALLLTIIVAIGTGLAIAADVASNSASSPSPTSTLVSSVDYAASSASAAAPSAGSTSMVVTEMGDGNRPDLSARRANAPIDDQTVAMLQRGAQLAALGDCMVCHTAKGGSPYAGGLPLKTPFGTLYSTNITPDISSGIGGWSEADFVKAMQQGVSKDGHLLYPAFPYVHFTHVSRDDLHALYGFLMHRDPVSATAPANKLIFPLNFRPLMAAWNLLFLHDVGVPPTQRDDGYSDQDAGSAEWRRGQYLVNSLGHCAACHTPLNFLGAEQRDRAFTGGLIDGWHAPALVDLANQAIPWTQPQLVAYLRTGLASEHGAAAGPMLPVTQHLADVPEADVSAIARYVMSLRTPQRLARQTGAADPIAAVTKAGANATVNPAVQASIQSGAVIFSASCASCHGVGAPMSTQTDRPPLSRSTSVHADDPRNAIQQILQGIPFDAGGEHGKTRYMPAFGSLLTDAQIAEVVNYVRVTYSGEASWDGVDAAAVAKIRKQ